ncbi:MAG: type II toxin-antitoxin system Phd/YefM family antitoxin [Saprospiraceae bacterium]
MRAITISKLRTRIKFFLDLVAESSEVLIIPRTKDNDDGVVIISLKEYNALTETNYLLSSEANRKRLLDSIGKLESEKLIPYTLNEDKDV